MDKRWTLLFTLGIFCISMGVIAQQSFLFSSPQTQPSTTKSIPNKSAILSPAEFSSQVSQIAAQNNAAFKQELNKRIAETPPPTTPKISSRGNQPTAGQSTLEAPKTPMPGTPAPLPDAEDVTTETTRTTTTTTTPAIPTKAPPTPESFSTTPPPQSGSNAPYTGFGGGTGTSGNAPSKPQNNSGGWNIKY